MATRIATIESRVLEDDVEPSPVFQCPTCQGDSAQYRDPYDREGELRRDVCPACLGEHYIDGRCTGCDAYPPIGARVHVSGDTEYWSVSGCGCSEVA